MTYSSTISVTQGSAATGNRFYPLVNTCSLSTQTTEANAQYKFRTSGKLKNFRIRVTSIATTADFTATIRKGGVATALTIVQTAQGNGEYTDLVDEVDVAAGDLMSVLFTSSASATAAIIQCDFIPNGNIFVFPYAAWGSVNFSTASTTRFINPNGDITLQTSEAAIAITLNFNGIVRNLGVYISANARTTNTTFGGRKNSANGNMSVVVGSGATGYFEDTTHSDTLVPTDKYNYSMTTSTGTKTITTRMVGAEYQSAGSESNLLAYAVAGVGVVANATRWTPVLGSLTLFGADVGRTYMPCDGHIFNFRAVVGTNTAAASTTATLQKNGVDTAITFTQAAGSTATMIDNTNTVTFKKGDVFSLKVVRPADTGSFILTRINSFIMMYGDPDKVMVF